MLSLVLDASRMCRESCPQNTSVFVVLQTWYVLFTIRANAPLTKIWGHILSCSKLVHFC